MSTDSRYSSSAEYDPANLTQLRLIVLNRIFWVITPLATIAATVGSIDEVREGRPHMVGVYVFLLTLVVLAAFVKRAGYSIRASILLAVLYLLAVSELWMFGIASMADMTLLMLVLFAGVFFTLRIGAAVLCLSFATIAIFASVYVGGAMPIVREPQAVSQSLNGWITITLVFTLLAAGGLAMLSMLLRRLEQSLQASRQLVGDMREEVAERRRAEEAERKSEKAYQDMFNSMTDGLTVFDPDGRPLDVNPAMCSLYGYSRDEFLSLHVTQLIRPDHHFVFDNFMQQLADTGTFHGESVDIRKDGSEVNVEIHGSVVQRGETKCLLAIIRDITERKLAETEHEKLEAQLLQSQKLESIGTLAGGIAHDFNNVLQAILGYGDIAMDKVAADSPVYEELKEMMKAGERARVLVQQLLAFSRRQVLELSNLNLDDVVEELLKMIQRVIGEHISLNHVSHDDIVIIHADRGQIEQILMNLCVNARDAMGDGGTLTIETAKTEFNQAFCDANTWARPGRYVSLSITDTGHGIDEETQQRIFEPFFTTKEPGKGTGLGLSTVFGIIRQHEGMVDVYSEIGVGTTFRIYFPAIEATETAQLKAKTAPAPVRGGSETILLADDDESVRNVAERMLSQQGYTVLQAGDGEEAIAVFDEHAHEIDLALLDVVMPKLGGKAVADHILKQRPELHILFSSGYSTDAGHTNFVLDEGMHLLQKPYHREQLLRKIREIIEDGAG